MNYLQQGDVLLKEHRLEENLKPINTDLLHKGEQHHHTLSGDFNIFEKEGIRYLDSRGCNLNHEEHKTIKIPKGFYKLEFVQEYDHFLEESRAVID